jgi:hypothetical protein
MSYGMPYGPKAEVPIEFGFGPIGPNMWIHGCGGGCCLLPSFLLPIVIK